MGLYHNCFCKINTAVLHSIILILPKSMVICNEENKCKLIRVIDHFTERTGSKVSKENFIIGVHVSTKKNLMKKTAKSLKSLMNRGHKKFLCHFQHYSLILPGLLFCCIHK